MRSFLIGRTGVWGMAFTAYRLWRRIPPQHRRRIVKEARTHGPRVAKQVGKRVRKPRG